MSLHISARANFNCARQQTLTVCHAKTEWAKNGTHSTFSRNGVPVLAAKNRLYLINGMDYGLEDGIDSGLEDGTCNEKVTNKSCL